MRYTEKKFSVSSPGTQEYADNWERTFGPKKCPHTSARYAHAPDADCVCSTCGAVVPCNGEAP